jgi:hypothetical protein
MSAASSSRVDEIIERMKPSTIKRTRIVSAQTTKSEYLLLFRGNEWYNGRKNSRAPEILTGGNRDNGEQDL